MPCVSACCATYNQNSATLALSAGSAQSPLQPVLLLRFHGSTNVRATPSSPAGALWLVMSPTGHIVSIYPSPPTRIEAVVQWLGLSALIPEQLRRRLLAPNDKKTFSELEPVLSPVLKRALGSDVTITPAGKDPKERFAARVQAPHSAGIATLIDRLTSAPQDQR